MPASGSDAEGPQVMDRAAAPGGQVLTLHGGDGVFQIRIDGRELMNSRHHRSERVLSQAVCARIADRPGAHVLIGGLGMGFTLRAALDAVPEAARVTVAEVFPAVIEWNRGPLAPLAGRPLDDPRVTATHADVADLLRDASGAFDAVLLDPDNGPGDLALPENAWLYSEAGIRTIQRALTEGGVLGVWSAAPAPELEELLRTGGFNVWTETVLGHAGDPRSAHTLVLAERSAGSPGVARERA